MHTPALCSPHTASSFSLHLPLRGGEFLLPSWRRPSSWKDRVGETTQALGRGARHTPPATPHPSPRTGYLHFSLPHCTLCHCLCLREHLLVTLHSWRPLPLTAHLCHHISHPTCTCLSPAHACPTLHLTSASGDTLEVHTHSFSLHRQGAEAGRAFPTSPFSRRRRGREIWAGVSPGRPLRWGPACLTSF